MAGKQSSPLCLYSSSYLTVLVLSCLLAASSSAPLAQRQLTAEMDGLRGVWTGSRILEWTISKIFPEDMANVLTSELRGTQFSKVVCPLFRHYSRFNLTLQCLAGDDSRHANISLITFLTKKLAKTACNYVKANCTENQQCSTMSCSISSLASLCLRTPSPRDIIDEIRSYTPPVYGNTAQMAESWLRQILQSSSGYPDRSVLDTLISVLHVTSLIRCNIPEDAPANQIRCNWDF